MSTAKDDEMYCQSFFFFWTKISILYSAVELIEDIKFINFLIKSLEVRTGNLSICD